jgi:hypothetical protein
LEDHQKPEFVTGNDLYSWAPMDGDGNVLLLKYSFRPGTANSLAVKIMACIHNRSERRNRSGYLPMQIEPNIAPDRSSLLYLPVISRSACCACRNSSRRCIALLANSFVT